MYDLSRQLKFPLMAGSSIPVTVRVPALSFPLGAPVEEAVGVGYAGLDSYGFHALEGLQCMLERRRGAESGIAAVETLSGADVWRWRDSAQGRWSAPLLDAALGCLRTPRPGPIEEQAKDATLFRLEYRDGFRAVVYMLGQYIDDIMFAARVKGEPQPQATRFDLTRRALPHFDGLVDYIEQFFVTGRPRWRPCSIRSMRGGESRPRIWMSATARRAAIITNTRDIHSETLLHATSDDQLSIEEYENTTRFGSSLHPLAAGGDGATSAARTGNEREGIGPRATSPSGRVCLRCPRPFHRPRLLPRR
jgi:hypothetical protein